MKKHIELTNSEIAKRIDEYIHSERNRQIMKMKLIDGLTYEKIAEITEMSPRHIVRIVQECYAALFPDEKIFAEICFS